MGPVTEWGPPPGLSLRRATISSIVIPGRTLPCACIIVSTDTISPESTVSLGGSFGSSQPHCTVSRVAARLRRRRFLRLARLLGERVERRSTQQHDHYHCEACDEALLRPEQCHHASPFVEDNSGGRNDQAGGRESSRWPDDNCQRLRRGR